jgi:aspartate kinase
MGSTLFKNASPNGWIVQKFGGTSVGKFPDKIAEDIVRYVSDSHLALGSVVLPWPPAAVRRRGETEGGMKQGEDPGTERKALTFFPFPRRTYVQNNRLVVVCSARSTGKKVTGTTSR